MNSKGKEEEPKLQYYYKKPGSKDGDPSIIMRVNGVTSSKGGEIIIGTSGDTPPINQMIVIVVRVALDNEFHKTMEQQKVFFGEKHYEPVRKELIRMTKSYLMKLKDKKVTLPIQVNKIVFDEDWKF